jgi:spermidine/putrescine transport system substrate-binding protein
LEQKKIFGNYCDSVTASEDVSSGKLWLTQEWSGMSARVIQENPNLKYVIPKEGGAVWIDTFFIPKKAKNKYTAEVFLNYLNRPEVNAKNVNYLKYPSCNFAAKEFIDKDILNNEVIYPTDEVKKRLDPFVDHVNDEEIFEMRTELWQELVN